VTLERALIEKSQSQCKKTKTNKQKTTTTKQTNKYQAAKIGKSQNPIPIAPIAL